MFPQSPPGPSKIVLPCRRELNFKKNEGSRRTAEKELQNDLPEGLREPLGEPGGPPRRVKNEPKSGPRAPRRELVNFFSPRGRSKSDLEGFQRGKIRSISTVRVPEASRGPSGSDFGASGD